MKKTLLLTLSLVLSMFAIAFIQPTGIYAQDKMDSKNVKEPKSKFKKVASVEMSAVKSTNTGKSGTNDPNIKEDETDTNDPDTAAGTLPSFKSGSSKSGVGECQIKLDNYTAYFTKIYINGIYKGKLYGGNESTLYYTPGQVTIYAKADFDDGSSWTWGPQTWSCGPNQYIYYRLGDAR